MKTIITTKGMHCKGCETRMVNALNNLEDIQGAKADATSGKVTIKHKNAETVNEAKALVAEIGFEVME